MLDKSDGCLAQPRFEFVLDILDGCANNCAGCYVTRRNSVVEADLASLNSLADGLCERGLSFDDFTLGPTDIFSASNFQDIASSAAFAKLIQRAGMSVSSTLMAAPTATMVERAEELVRLSGADVDILMLILLDVPRLISDPLYLSKLSSRANYLAELGFDIAFLANYSGPSSLAGLTVQQLRELLTVHFPFAAKNVPLKLIPSFYNLKKSSIVNEQYLDFKKLFELSYALTEHHLADLYFSHKVYRFLLKNGSIYAAPYLVDAIASQNQLLSFRDLDADTILAELGAKISSQFLDVPLECQSCTWLIPCADRHVLSLRQIHGLASCPVPFGGQRAIAER